jgi:hypothetical protein
MLYSEKKFGYFNVGCVAQQSQNTREKVTVGKSLLLTSVTGGYRFGMSSHLVRALAVKCLKQFLFSYQFADVGQENQRNVAKLTLNGKPR